MSSIRLATIGTSVITRTFLAAAAEVPEVDVTTACSRNPERAARFAGDTGIPESASDLDALLRSGRIDAVYIASPNGAHAEQVRRALEAGVHVLVEKPATPTEAEFAELVALAEERGLVLLEAMRNAYDPGLDAVADLAADLGPIRLASFSYCKRSARYDDVLAGDRVNIFDPALAGGALYDLGVYCVSAMVQLFGEPVSVSAASAPIATGADGAGILVAQYPGCAVSLTYSKVSASATPNEIQGELGTLTFDEIAAPREAVVTLLDGTRTTHRIDGPRNNMSYEIRRFAELISGDRDAAVDHERTLATLRVIDAARASLR